MRREERKIKERGITPPHLSELDEVQHPTSITFGIIHPAQQVPGHQREIARNQPALFWVYGVLKVT